MRSKGPKVSKGRPESPLVASAEAKAFVIRKRKVGPFPACRKETVLYTNFYLLQRGRRFPKGDRKALWSPPQRRNLLRNRKKIVKPFSLPPTRNLFLVGGFVRLRADEVLSPRGKVPKGRHRLRIRQRRIRRSQSDLAFAKRKPTLGGQRVHAAWPPPVPPLLSYSAPLASQGRAQLGSRPSLGGPLSPSAQLIPPPAPRRRFIPGVSARDHYGRNTLPQYVPRHQGHAQCVPTPAPDWLLAHGQTKWRGRCGPCRSRNRGKHPSAAKKARRLPTCGLSLSKKVASCGLF